MKQFKKHEAVLRKEKTAQRYNAPSPFAKGTRSGQHSLLGVGEEGQGGLFGS